MENIKNVTQIDINGIQYYISHTDYQGMKSGIDGTIIHMDKTLDNDIYNRVLQKYINDIANTK